jgi:geranylgeranyl diphosphate synthase type I
LKLNSIEVVALGMLSEKEKIESIFKKTAKIVDPAINELLDLYVSRKRQRLVRYQISTGGKRLRPALAILSARLFGGKTKDVLYPAAGLEILHNYSLIIDDIIDNSSLRRGNPTVWVKFGKSIAQCVAADYSAAVFQAANRSKNVKRISEVFARTIKSIINGEILDILFEQAGREDELYVAQNRYTNVSERDYLEMVSQKTVVLFQACCEVGGLCAGASAKEIKALRDYGFDLGMAFQISDDILDIFGSESKFGKKIGKDIEERKLGNIIIYFATQEFSSKEKKDFRRLLCKNRIIQEDIKKAMNLIQKTQAKTRALNYGKKFIERAKRSLDFLPKNKYNSILEGIADLVMKREK